MTLDLSDGLVRRYMRANPPLATGDVLPAIPEEFMAALERVAPHDPAAFRQLLVDYNIHDAAALVAIVRVIRYYGATEALAWIDT